MWANFDQYTPPNKTKLETINSTKNTLSSHLSFKFKYWRYDQIKPVKEDEISARTKKSAYKYLIEKGYYNAQ